MVFTKNCLNRGSALKYRVSTSTPSYFVDFATNVWQRLRVSVAGDDGLGDPILEADANFPSNSGVTKHYIKLAGLLQKTLYIIYDYIYNTYILKDNVRSASFTEHGATLV